MADDKRRDEELDRFWTIDELLPRRRNDSPLPPQKLSTEPIEFTFDPPSPTNDGTARTRLTLPREESAPRPLVRHDVPLRTPSDSAPKHTPIDSYSPDNSLIRAVRIYRWPSAYTYYARFLADARHYLHTDAPPCPREPFFSYVPQYSQLTPNRLNWYLYWRSQVRAGVYPDCDYTYLLLYLYEIINLADEIPPAEGVSALCALWLGYRMRYPRLDRFLGEWICDYCLIHHLPPPGDLLGDEIALFIEGASLKEFWLSRPGSQTEAYAGALIRFASNYDYHKSKFATAENLPLYDRHIYAAMSAVVSACAGDETHLLGGGGLQESRLSRDAFGGALCAHENKYRIEVDYCSFTRSHELRFLVSDIIKYTENRLRAYLGIKSRLGLYALPNDIRAMIDHYLAGALPAHEPAPSPRRAAEAAEEKQYAPLYEPLSTTLSPEHAAAIESASWNTTRRLVEAFGESEQNEPAPPPPPPPAAETADVSLPSRLRECGLDAFVRALRDGNHAAAKAEADRRGMLLDAAADRVNEIAVECFGDILLEQNDPGRYAVIDDYRDELNGL